MVRRKKTIIIEGGKEIEVEMFDTKIALGSGEEIDKIEDLFREEEIENEIQKALEKIDGISKNYKKLDKNLNYYYEVGKILQFVDEKGYSNVRGLIWERMAYNLRADLFGGKKKNATESKRYPEMMYHLAKQPKKILHRADWDQWYEIMKFRELRENPDLIEKVLQICETKSPSGRKLRDLIKELL